MIFVASSHARISVYRGQSQTSPPAAQREIGLGPAAAGGPTDAVTGLASAILASCTALMGTAATAAARSDRGWCEPGDTRSGPDHPGAAGRTAPRFISLNRGGGTALAAASAARPAEAK